METYNKNYCSDCGSELESDDFEFCPNCGVVFGINHKIIKSTTPATEPANNNIQKEVKTQKNTLSFSIASGEYEATFDLGVTYERNAYEEYMQLSNTSMISWTIVFLCLLLFIIPLACFISSCWDFAKCIGVGYYICIALVGLISYIIATNAEHSLNSLKYDYIIYELLKCKVHITYQNKSTGTISYKVGNRKTQLSVYRGYNSHSNSRYWN